MKHQIVLGSFFGDEGKGATVQWLCKKAIEDNKKPIVVRFSGGAQCGHRIINNSIEHVCSSFGSGVLLNVPTYLNENVYIDPVSIKNEYEEIYRKTGIKPILFIDSRCRITTPFDILSNRQNKETLSHGSCGEGIFATFKRCMSAEFKRTSLSSVFYFPEQYINEVRAYYNIPDNDKDASIHALAFRQAVKWLKKKCTLVENNAFTTIVKCNNYNTIIWEGSQGMLLDMEYGFMPHCTPSKTGLNGISSRYLDNAEVFLVMRSYLTRHGNGFTPLGENVVRNNYINLEEPTNDNTGYQGIFKIGVFDLMLLRTLWNRHHLDNCQYFHNVKYNIVMNHLDCISNTFYYTENEKSIESIKGKDLTIGIKKLFESKHFNFSKFYAGFGQDNIKEI